MAKKKTSRVPDESRQSALDGLRDALDLTLTRVIEDDKGVEQAREVLKYLENELQRVEKGTGRKRKPAARRRRRP